MPKINKKSVYFRQVASVLGRKRAFRELSRAANVAACSFGCPDRFDDDTDDRLSETFYWHESPQGAEFWGRISISTESIS